MKSVSAVGGACVAFAVVAVGFALAMAQKAYSQPESASVELARPHDVESWVTVGVTVRLDREHGATPWQMRQVLMPPEDYERFNRTGQLADGARLAVLFYPVALDSSHAPALYHARSADTLAVHVIDRAHPDGRRFYVFASDAARASALPPGNECAVCHNARGGFEGTFAQMYPLMARRLGEAEPR
jgi:hypothetical protein